MNELLSFKYTEKSSIFFKTIDFKIRDKMKSLTKLRGSILFLSMFAVLLLYALFAYSAPQWVSGTNSTSPTQGVTYNPSANYSFQINWTDSDNNFANATFQLGRPSGSLSNYTDNTTGLVGYWRLNAVNGTNYTKDFSGYGNDGQLKSFGQCGSGASTCNLTSGKIGNAIAFDGANDYVDVPSLATESNAKTLEVWFKAASLPASYHQIAGDSYDGGAGMQLGYMLVTSGATLVARVANSSQNYTEISTSIVTNAWYHAVLVHDYNNNLLSLYLNGTKINETGINGYYASPNAFRMGRYSGYETWLFNGTIDEVRIYNRSLSAAEISTLYQMRYPYYAGTDDSLNGTWAINFTQDQFGPVGTYNYTWFATNTSGGQNSTQTIGYNITKAIPTIMMSNTTDSVNTSGMVFYMPFSEGSGVNITEDKSGWGNNGTLTNMNTTGNSTSGWTSGKYGGGLQFDGVNDYVDAGNGASLNITNAITIEAWITSNNLILPTVNPTILSKSTFQNGYIFQFISGGKLKFYLGDGSQWHSAGGDTVLSTNTWYHVVGVYDKQNIQVYINGVKESTVTAWTGTFTSPATNLIIGYDYGTHYFNGTIDEVRIYNRSLSAAEISMLYNSSKYYPYASNVSASISNSEQTLNLYRYENTSISVLNDTIRLGAGEHYWIANASSTQNYTKIETLLPFQILQNSTNPISLWMMNNSVNLLNQNISGTYPMLSNTTAYLNYIQSGTVNLYYNDLLNNTLNNTNMTLAAGSYKITANTSGNGNYTSNSTNYYIAVNQASPYVNITFSSNNTVYAGDNWANGTAYVNFSSLNPLNWTAYRNSTLVDNTTGLAGRWSFDELSGSTAVSDSSGNGNNGTLTNMNTTGNATSGWTTGKFGNALQFDGLDDYVIKAPIGVHGLSSGSMSLWFKTDSQQTSTFGRQLLSIPYDSTGSNGWDIGIDGAGTAIRAGLKTSNEAWGTAAYTFTYYDNNWHNVVNVYNGSFMTLYVDGINRGSIARTGTISALSDELNIARFGSFGNYFNGTIDEVRIYNRSLSASEIAEHYLAGANRLGVGVYNYILNTSGNANYTSFSYSTLLNINKAATLMKLWLNNTEGNKAYNQSDVANFTSQLNVSKAITLTSNYTGFADRTGTQAIYNYTNLTTIGSFFNLTSFWNGNENYTASSTTYFFNVNDVTPPMGVSNLSNTSQGTTWILWNWSNPSDSDFDHAEIWINGTSRTNTSNNYYNASLLSPNVWYEIQVRTADLYNNTNLTFINSTAKTSGETDATLPTITSHSATPKVAINGTNVSLQMGASDDYAIHTKWAQITMPNSSQDIIVIPSNYTTSRSGRYNITFFANDTSNNIASVTDHFIAQPSSNINITVGRYDNSAITTNVTIYYDSSAVNAIFSGGNYSLNLSDYVYDLDFASFNSSLGVMLRGVNISYNQGRTILFDNTSVSGYLATYAVNSTFNMSSAQVTLNYSGSGYNNEDYLSMYKCSGWDISARSCSGSWALLSSVQNKSAKTIAANVTGFSAFSIKQESAPEATVTSSASSSSSSTSGGLSAETKKKIEEENQRNLILDKESMKFNMIIGQTKIDTFKITNNKTEKISVSLELKNLDKYAVLSEYKFELGPKESKIVSVTAVAGEKYGVFAGELAITDSVTKTVPIVLEVESAERLFDAKVDITPEYKKVLPGEDLKTQVTLLSMGPIEKKTDVTVQYSLKSASGDVLHEESETFAVERQKSFTKEFSIPSDAKPGDYILAIEVIYGNSFAVSSDMFKVVEKQEASVLPGVDYAWAVFLLAAIPVVAYVLKFRSKIFANNSHINNSQKRKFLMQAKAISLMRFKTRESHAIPKKRRNNQTHNAKPRRTRHDNF